VFGKSFLALAQLPLQRTSWLSLGVVVVVLTQVVEVLVDTEHQLELLVGEQALNLP
jgi:hypothetical protein